MYPDPAEYWRDAAEIVTGHPANPDVLRCFRTDENGQIDEIYWDVEKQAIVIVKNGRIVTYFKPSDGFDYWLRQCP